jgi:hypothetical protein
MVPHVAARKTHRRSLEFSFNTPKRLLQQYPPTAAVPSSERSSHANAEPIALLTGAA